MYKVLLNDETAILDPSQGAFVEEPDLSLEDSSAGSFSFTIYPENPGYELVSDALMTGSVSVFWDDDLLYRGRIIQTEKGFRFGITVQTEGELAYLADTIQRPAEYHEATVRAYLSKLIAAHNAQVDSSKAFEVGVVTVDNDALQVHKYTNWESTLDVILKDLVEDYGGHLRVRHANGHRYLDYLKDWPRLSDQQIEFGENLLDYSENTSATDLATVCIPLGARQEQSDIEALEKRLTIESVNGGSDALELPEAIAKYGRIVKTLVCDDVETASILKKRGQDWLTSNQYETMELTLSAVDLADFGVDTDHLRMLDRIRCTSDPHGLDREMGLTAVHLKLLDPVQNTYTLGSKQAGFSKSVRQSQYQMLADLRNQPTKHHVLTQALENATQLLTSVGKDGHVIFSPSLAEPNELFITDYDNLDDAQHCWRWNLNGLGYSSTGINGPFETAITMDGTIAGKFIAAGTIGADQISIEYTSEQDTKLQNGLKNTSDGIKLWASEGLAGALNDSKAYTDSELNGYYTKAQIDVKTNSITSTVSQKVGASEVSSMISQSASAIRLKATTLAWDADKSSMDSSGELTAWKMNAMEGIEVWPENVNTEPYIDFHSNLNKGTDYQGRLSLENSRFKFKTSGGATNGVIQCGDIYCNGAVAVYKGGWRTGKTKTIAINNTALRFVGGIYVGNLHYE